MLKQVLPIILIILLHACGTKDIVDDNYYTEPHRPQFHFSPEANWMNDPNGMVYHDGEYHLFYQYYPDSTVWGPMHWGHAVSTDLVHWEHLPIALYPDSLGWIFSGSAVDDKNNTSGLGENGKGPLVAIFSYHNAPLEKTGTDKFQYQGIAYSNDRGRSWTKYADNPVVENPGIRDFRDPKVIWHQKSQKWVMAVSALDHLLFYGSADLKKWEVLSDFGQDIGSHDGVWECPDLFPLEDEQGNIHWVLIENMNPGNPNGGSGTQYFIGDFDGEEFTVDPSFNSLLPPLEAYAPEGEVFEDFETGYDGWTLDGDAFGNDPATGTLANQNTISGFEGKGLVNSFFGGNTSTGSLTSEPFTVTSDAINFLIGGGNHRERTQIQLIMDDRIVRVAEGRNNERLEWRGWNVSGFQGQEAQIRIIDYYTSDWGYICIDDITFADEVAHGEITGSVWLDAGRDNYAGVTWSDVPERDGRRIFMGWMSNWAYAQIVPTSTWRSAMTIPWELEIQTIDGIPRLTGFPVKELDQLVLHVNTPNVEEQVELPESGLAQVSFSMLQTSDRPVGFKLSNEQNEFIQLTFDPKANLFVFDRSQSGETSFSGDFGRLAVSERLTTIEEIQVDFWLDHASVEIFLDKGVNIFTEIFFPTSPFNQLEFSGDPSIDNLKVKELKSIW